MGNTCEDLGPAQGRRPAGFATKIVLLAAAALLAAATTALAGTGGEAARPAGPQRSTEAGFQLWATRYDGTGGGADEAVAIAASPDGSKVFVTGSSTSSRSGDYLTAAYDAAGGGELWTARYDGPDHLLDRATAIAVSPDGLKVFVTGFSTRKSYHYTAWATAAYDTATGSQLWVRRLTGPVNNDNEARALAVSPDGTKLFVTGFSSYATGYDGTTVAYAVATGTRLWRQHFDSGETLDEGTALRVAPDGSKLFVTGFTGNGCCAGDVDFITLAYKTRNGKQLWEKRYQSAEFAIDEARAVGVSPDGSRVFVTGSSGPPDSPDYLTIAYSASDGSQLWLQRSDGPGHAADTASGLAVSPDGSKLFVTGTQTQTDGETYFATEAYATATGASVWAAAFGGFGTSLNRAAAIAASPDGSRVYVTGSTKNLNDQLPDQYVLVAYDASHPTSYLWAMTYAHLPLLGDEPAGLAVSPDDSKVFITGRSTGATSDYDYATAAYSTS